MNWHKITRLELRRNMRLTGQTMTIFLSAGFEALRLEHSAMPAALAVSFAHLLKIFQYIQYINVYYVCYS